MESSTNNSALVRSMWRRNSWPIPRFRCASSTKPGRSATFTDCPSGSPTVPINGANVVNGYDAILGVALDKN